MRIFSPSFVLNGRHQSIFFCGGAIVMKILLKKVPVILHALVLLHQILTHIFRFLPGQSSTLSRSHSIASAGDKSLILSTVSSPNTTMHHPGRHVSDVSNERLLHELQMSKKQQACVLLLLFLKIKNTNLTKNQN